MTVARFRQLGPISLALVASLLVGLAPAGAAVRAAPTHPLKMSPRPVAVVAAVQLAAPSPTPAPAALTLADPTPRPTLSGTMPPATIPPAPVPPPPSTPLPQPATLFARVVNTGYATMRSSPSGTSTALIKVPHGQIAGILAVSLNGEWYKTNYRGKTGYIRTTKLQRMSLVGKTIATQYARVIVVARRQQHLEVWDHGALRLITAVTTGRPELVTPLGTTKVLRKDSPHLFQSPWQWPSIYWYPPGWADFAVLFRTGGFYFHDTHARPENGYGIGTNVLHTDPDGVQRTGSRGCVNTPHWAVRALFGWSLVGDMVVVVDA